MSQIEIKNFTKKYGDFTAVDDISFTVNKGEVLGLLGPNGAGKSTTIRSICCYLKPTAGEINVTGLSVSKNPIEVKKKIGYLPESAPIYGEMMVYEYLSYIADIRGVPNQKARIRELAELCGLKEKIHVNIHELSKGYKQRVGLAHAMISDPEILVLDEPTSGLDPNQIVEIRELIKTIGREKTVILSTHILTEVEATCDRIIIISRGKVVANGTTKELKGEDKTVDINIEVSGVSLEKIKEEFSSFAAVKSVRSLGAENGSTRVSLSCDGETDVRKAVYEKIKAQNWDLLDFHRESKSLEKVFQDLTKDK